MASPRRRAMLDRAARGGSGRDSGTQDITNPIFLTRPELGARRVRTLSGRGIEQPGYTIIGTQEGALSEGIAGVRVVKMVSPLTGQGPADPLATGRYANMDLGVVPVRIVRVARSVPPNTGSKVVRPKLTAIRRMDTKGQGTVSYY